MNQEKQFKFFLVATLFIIIIFIYYQPINEGLKGLLYGSNLPQVQSEVAADTIVIPLKPISELNGLSADTIEKKRAKALKKSPLAIDNYKMNRSVFQIVDGLPWISLPELTCHGVTPKISEGPSRESISINNPLLLISITTSQFNNRDLSTCSEADYFMAKSLVYSKKKNTYSATFDITSFIRSYNGNLARLGADMLILNSVNARDLGYEYCYIENNNGMYFKDKNHNPLTEVSKLVSFVHKGFACKLPSGCNNNSPYSRSYSAGLRYLPAKVRFKLWKKKPFSKYAKADVYFEMIFK